MKHDVNEAISRLNSRLRKDPRLSFLLRDWDILLKYLERDQKSKDNLLKEYLKIVYLLEVSKTLPQTAQGKELLTGSLPMVIAKIVGDYDYADHEQRSLAADKIKNYNTKVRQAILEAKQKEAQERKSYGRSNMGRSKTPTISRIKRSQNLDK